MPRVIDDRQRPPGRRTESAAVVSELKPTPVDAGRPQWRSPGTSVYGILEIPTPSTETFDVAIEASDSDDGPWYTLIAATGVPAVGETRDGSPYVPRVGFRSTKVTASRLRLVVTNHQAARFAASIEVE